MQTADSLHPATDTNELARYLELGEAAYSREAASRAITYVVGNPGTTINRILLRAYSYWFTDILGAWPWFPGPAWWTRGWTVILFHLGEVLVSVVPLLLFIGALVTGRLWRVPYAWLIVAAVLILPIPCYLMQGKALYSYLVKPYMLMYGVLAIWWGRGGADLGRHHGS